MPYFRVEPLTHLDDSSPAAYHHRPCPTCGRSVRVQIRDVTLLMREPFVGVTYGSELIASKDVSERIVELEPSVQFRRATILGMTGEWVQVIPTSCLELTDSSLRAPRVYCATCGGVARPRVATYPPLIVKPSEGPIRHMARTCGSAGLLLVTPEMRDLLQQASPTFYVGTRVLVEGEPDPGPGGGWSGEVLL